MKGSQKYRLKLSIALAFFICLLMVIIVFFWSAEATGEDYDLLPAPRLVLNPYERVDWDSYGQYKANLHAHTLESDGFLEVWEVIEEYHSRGYHILSITDHDDMRYSRPTWPWQAYGMDPEKLGMLAVKGNELSFQHHIGSYFSNYYGYRQGSVDESLRNIGEEGGLAVFFHPGRYNSPDKWRWYLPYFRKYPHLLGMEVYNMGDRYPRDRELWDNLLFELMPYRPVWGFSNDDMHQYYQIGRNWNVFLMPELSEKALRRALKEGQFYFTYAPEGSAAGPPVIKEIKVDPGSITIHADNCHSIYWISGGHVIAEGETIMYLETGGVTSYVRARLVGEGGSTYTNPFGFLLEATGIEFEYPVMVLPADGGSHIVDVNVIPRGAPRHDIVWSSSNEDRATFKDGVVTPHYIGLTVLSAAIEGMGLEAQCYLFVIPHLEEQTRETLAALRFPLFITGLILLFAWYFILRLKNMH